MLDHARRLLLDRVEELEVPLVAVHFAA
jgi:hypothetical protein